MNYSRKNWEGSVFVNRDHYKDIDGDHVLEWLGMLPRWVAEYNLGYGGDDLKDHLDKSYGYGLYEFKGTTITEDGVYQANNDEDPDLQFIAMMYTDKGKVYFYPYAITAIPTDEGYFVTRMD